jgi:Flp pilus assembly pilin Flp
VFGGAAGLECWEEEGMSFKSVFNSVVALHKDRAGQGLVEYLLILALVALAATAGMKTLANGINSAFTQLNTILGTYIT